MVELLRAAFPAIVRIAISEYHVRVRTQSLAIAIVLSISGSDAYATEAPKGGHVDIAFVLIPNAVLPRAVEVVEAFKTFAISGEKLELSVPKETAKSDGMLEFTAGKCGMAHVALMPAPVPKGEADQAAEFSISSMGTKWELPRHGAHLLVTLGGAESGARRASLSCLTSLLAAISKVSAAVGVYWGNAGATHDPAFVMSIARERDPAARMMLWTGVSIGREPDGRLSILSLGMERQLNLPDLLLVAPQATQGADALGTFFDLLGYVAERAKPIPEGNTVGATEDQRLPVRYVPSPIDKSKRVWRVELE